MSPTMQHLSVPKYVIAIGIMAAAVYSDLAHSKCHVGNFDQDQIQTVLRDSESASENLAALIGASANRRASDLVLIMAAARAAKSDAKTVAYFVNLLYLQSQMVAATDKKTVDAFIEIEAPLIYKDLQADADWAAQVSASGMLIFGVNEIREARDAIRKLQGFFSCAADAE